jgi:L-erythro-3,5-diaminohexanoate dehydrogenase
VKIVATIGCKYGSHRVISPAGGLPQAADVISNDPEIFDNEILIDVEALNIDSASFRQLEEEAAGDQEKMKQRILSIVEQSGKMKNPVTGSGGVLIGRIEKIGAALHERIDAKVGDRLVTLVSLSLTPLKLDTIEAIHMATDRVDVRGKAILFETSQFAILPPDIPDNISLAVLDVAGAPAQMEKLAKPGDKVLILGASGKSGMLCAYVARKKVGADGLVIGIVRDPVKQQRLETLGYCDEVICVDACRSIEILEKSLAASGGEEYDLVVNCLNVPVCEMSCILPVKDQGVVYFFSMATSFTKAALGAEGVGKDITMIIGNGYTAGHADYALQLLRESPELYQFFESNF